MVRICQQCGDKGWSVALIYCNRCINFAVHRYCLPKIPPTFDEYVSWACEDCEQRTPKNKSLNHPMDCETETNTRQEDTGLDAEKVEKIQDFSLHTQFPEAPATPIEPEVKTRNDAVDSETNMEETKASQTLNSAKKKPKKRRKTVTCGKRKKKKIVNPIAKKQEEPEQVKPTEDAGLITNEDKTSQTPNSTKKKPKKRKTVTCGTRKRRKNVHLIARKLEEPEEMYPNERTEMPKITNDAIDSKSEENKTSQSPNSPPKKQKRKRKTVTCGMRKRRRVVSTTEP